MGIEERRARERDRRRREILDAAWHVAGEVGWSSFSVERVGARAELGRATVYGYFESLEALVETMAEEALRKLSNRVSSTRGLAEALDAPVRFSQAEPAAFALIFQQALDPRPAFSSEQLERVRAEAQQLIRTLLRLAARPGVVLPEDAESSEAFLTGIAMAGVSVPELRSNTPLRRKWQDFCLSLDQAPKKLAADEPVGKPGDPATGARKP
jgi:AcrR family transcriptional regulator